jgi:mannose-6-phosphate isomerase-like protein (cupin superfamily)
MDDRTPPGSAPGQVLHGGAERRAVRWRTDGPAPLGGLSWYAVAPGAACSAHVHAGKAETWMVVAGRGIAVIGGRELPVAPGDAMTTQPGTPHALRNTGDEPLVFVNIVSLVGPGPVSTTELDAPA